MARDPYKYFRVEARELLDQLDKSVLDLEKGSEAPDLVPRVLRLAHTLKGAARVVRQREIAEEAHAIEDALAPFRESAVPIPRERIDALLRALDGIAGRVASLAAPAEAEPRAASRAVAEEALRTIRADIEEMDALLDGVAEAHARLGRLRREVAPVERARHLVELLAEQLAARHDREGGRAGGGVSPRILSLSEELRAILGGTERGLIAGADEMDRELRQIRAAAEQLRLVPAGALFTSLERAARDIAQTQGKLVSFEARGNDVRLDAHVLGAVQGALLQVVRNAVAHGIEAPAEREAAGKPSEGRMRVEVASRGRRVVFTCSDDGRGVDIEAVRRAAQRKGLLSAAAQRLGPEELLRLLLRGGISTTGAVTEVSGRGIGLDVVREVAERLGGEVSVRTQAGGGTVVELVVPLSLASLEALGVEAAGTVASIPLDAVRGALRIAPHEVARTAQGESVVHQGRLVPFVSLARVLDARSAPPRASQARPAVVVERQSGMAAVGVDRLLGAASVVLKALPELAPASGVVAGTSLDAEGNPQLVLDPEGLIAEAQRAEHTEDNPQAEPRRLLVIDDSLTTRMLEQSILESAGYDVDVATSGEEALEKARQRRYALFLVDIEMPGMDGFAFIERCRSDPSLRGIPSILVTSRSSAEDRRRGLDVGAQGYVAKSEFDQQALLERIRELVE
jgi:two-component system chemotaxis sensor kinase CheA